MSKSQHKSMKINLQSNFHYSEYTISLAFNQQEEKKKGGGGVEVTLLWSSCPGDYQYHKFTILL